MGIIMSSGRSIELASEGYLNNPFVSWENLGAVATLSGTTPIAGGERANAVTGSTYDKFRAVEASGIVTLEFDLGESKTVRMGAIIAHNAGTLGASVLFQMSDDGVTWTSTTTAVTPTDNTPMVWRTSITARYWRFRFSGLAASAQVNIGVAFIGNEIIIPTRLYQGFSPVLTPTEVQLQSNVSIGGELLGSSVITRGSTLSADITYVPAAFIRSADWLAFQRSFGEGKGFIFAWRPDKYTQDAHYCWRSGDVIRPSNTGPSDLMGINFNSRVHENG